ncbi:hypothetical protein C0993_001469 [Termitomyces sp. T159_Od127]|nr:hypothetical protein C0993_001469 [Termitomyces sp. T159_Od127]
MDLVPMPDIQYRKYLGESDLPHVMDLVQSELSEPYVIYTFRYFLHHCSLVRNSIEAMKEDGVDEIVLETEYDNHAALSLYESLGFIREKRLHRFYLNGKDAFRLVLAVPRSYSDDSSDTSGSSPRYSSFSSRRQTPYRAIRVSPYSDEEDDTVSSR